MPRGLVFAQIRAWGPRFAVGVWPQMSPARFERGRRRLHNATPRRAPTWNTRCWAMSVPERCRCEFWGCRPISPESGPDLAGVGRTWLHGWQQPKWGPLRGRRFVGCDLGRGLREAEVQTAPGAALGFCGWRGFGARSHVGVAVSPRLPSTQRGGRCHGVGRSRKEYVGRSQANTDRSSADSGVDFRASPWDLPSSRLPGTLGPRSTTFGPDWT